jgi:hypothetical protein
MPSDPIINWNDILSWDSIGWCVAVLIGAWGALIGSGDYTVANAFFVLAAVLSIIQWGKATSLHLPSRRRTVAFVLGCVLAVAVAATVIAWTSGKAREAEKQKQQLHQLTLIPGLNSSIATLKSDLEKAETGRQVDNAYLKAKLEDAYKANDDLRQFAPAIMQLARTSAELSKKQYDQKVLDDKQLRDFTESVIARIRNLEGEYNFAERQQSQAMWQQRLTRTKPPSPTQEELRKQAQEDMQQEMSSYIALRSQYEQIFRSTIMGDAQYARRELLSRVGGDSWLSPLERSKSISIDGILAGPSPVGDAADYLEALVRKLSP